MIGWRTLYDLLVETYIEAGLLPQPATVSFRDDVLPLLRRLTGLQWVNKGFAEMFGKGAPWDFSDDALIAKLAAKPLRPGGQDVYGELRRLVLNAFRPSDTQADEPRLWPWIYGDAIDFPRRQTPRNDVALSPLQTTILTRWVAGDFESDVAPVAPPRTLAQVPLAAQPAMLDRAALHFCLADAFHPGCELTWPMRHASLYEAPFRIRHRPASAPEPDYGDVLTPEIALGPDGPLQAQGPGGLTRWMAVPGRPTRCPACPATRMSTTPSCRPSGPRACRTTCSPKPITTSSWMRPGRGRSGSPPIGTARTGSAASRGRPSRA